MAEVLVFAEGSAWVYTGTNSGVAAYVRNVRVQFSISYTAYKPPHATTYTVYPYASAATLSIDQAFSNPTFGKLFDSATGGGYHVGLRYLAGGVNQSGGINLYSGWMGGASFTDGGQGEVMQGLQGTFPSWSRF